MKKWCIRALAVLMAVLVLFPAPELAPVVQAVTQAEIDSLKQDASSLDKKKAELQKQLKAISADKNKAMQQKNLLEDQIDVLQSEINVTNKQIGKYDELIASLESQLETNQQEESRLYTLLCECVRYMEEEGNTGYWGILFRATSFSDLLDRFIMINEIVEYNQNVLDELAATREQIRQDKSAVEVARAEQLKEENQMEWICRMHDMEARARELVCTELIYK